MVEESLNLELLADATVAGLIGTRLYPYLVPQDAELPAIAYQRISGPREYSHDGPSGQARALIQLTIEAATYAAAKSTAAAVRSALSGFRGILGGAGGTAVGGIFIENEIDGYSEIGEARTVRLDVSIQYGE